MKMRIEMGIRMSRETSINLRREGTLFHVALIVLLLTSSATGFAQQATDSLPVKSGNEWQMPKQALQRSQTFADSVKRKCSLDDLTTKKVFNAYLANTKSVDEIKLGQGSEKDKQKLLLANKEQFDNKLKNFLTPSQFEMYQRSR